MNIELEVPYQINRLSECFKNNLIEYSQLVEHLNRLIGKEKAEYYLKVIKESPDIPQLSKEFNLETILNRTDELLKEYNKVNHQILTQEQLIDNYNKKGNNDNNSNNSNNKNNKDSFIKNYKNKQNKQNKQNNNISNNINKCNCMEIYGKDVFNFNLMDYLSKNADVQMTDACTESCIYLIVKKYQEVIEYANNKIFFLRSLKTSKSGYFKSSENIGFIEFNQYMEDLLHPISPMHKKVEDAIKFKIHNKQITMNKDCHPSFGFWLNNNNIAYEITKDTPIK